VYGSPEIKSAIKVEIKNPRRKRGDIYDLVPTDKNGSPIASAPAAVPAPVDSTDLSEQPPAGDF
jgi:hypothetical protein